MKITSSNIVLILVLILGSSFYTTAQSSKKDCDIRFDNIDKFTKVRQVCTQSQKLFVAVSGVLGAIVLPGAVEIKTTKVDVCALNVAGRNYVQLEFGQGKDIPTHAFKTWHFMLSSDEVVSINSTSIKNLDEGNYTFNPNVVFLDVNEDMWRKLSSETVKMIRVSNDEVNNLWEFEVKSKYGESISKVIDCLEGAGIPKLSDLEKK
jgi:hypothetical protein